MMAAGQLQGLPSRVVLPVLLICVTSGVFTAMLISSVTTRDVPDVPHAGAVFRVSSAFTLTPREPLPTERQEETSNTDSITGTFGVKREPNATPTDVAAPFEEGTGENVQKFQTSNTDDNIMETFGVKREPNTTQEDVVAPSEEGTEKNFLTFQTSNTDDNIIETVGVKREPNTTREDVVASSEEGTGENVLKFQIILSPSPIVSNESLSDPNATLEQYPVIYNRTSGDISLEEKGGEQNNMDDYLFYLSPSDTDETNSSSSAGANPGDSREGDTAIAFSLNVTADMINTRSVTLPPTLPGLSTPCWREPIPPGFTYQDSLYRCHLNYHKLAEGFQRLAALYRERQAGSGSSWRMRCFPAFFLLGVAKCGTTDLFEALTKHPDVARPDLKEPEYWSYQREKINPLIFNKGCPIQKDRATFSDYLDVYDSFADGQLTSLTEGRHTNMLGDFSTHTLDVVESWDKSLEAPEFTSADVISSLSPKSKFILMIRDPVDRAYSRYKMRFSREDGVAGTPDDFHKRITRQAAGSASCLDSQSHRFCVYKQIYGNEGNHAMVNGGLYSVFLEDWLKIVPRDQIHVIRFEDYVANRTKELDRVVAFLGLEPFSAEVRGQIKVMAATNPGPSIGDMLPETRQALQNFYRPHNARLAAILRDESFTWNY